MKQLHVNLFLILFLLVSCVQNNTSEEISDSTKVVVDNSEDSIQIKEYIHPLDRTALLTDTLISDLGIRVKILSTPQETSVQQTDDNITYNYSDWNHQLTISKDDELLMDTVFVKSNFLDKSDEEFLKIAIFNQYWFDGFDDSSQEIKFFGVISKPDTDWSFTFYHKFSIKNNSIVFEQHIEEEI